MKALKFNYYDILEVSPYCPQHEVSTAFERAKITYSGENPAIYTIFSEVEAREMMKLIDEAYSVLGNKTLRTLYDEKIGGGKSRPSDLSFENLQAESKTVLKEFPKRKSAHKFEYTRDEVFENEISNTKEWTGVMLRKVREYKHISLDLMSEITKISAFYLNAIEELQPNSLPAFVFVRGYVAQISKVLVLNEKIVCDSYMKIYKEVLAKE